VGLEGRTVLVTGASGGIGGATVRQLVAAGADVIASGRNAEALNDLAAKTGCRALPFDLASEDGVQQAPLVVDPLQVCLRPIPRRAGSSPNSSRLSPSSRSL
jgi:NADP-dependent 3-hydroxy acid dehydrogenase YdfG